VDKWYMEDGENCDAVICSKVRLLRNMRGVPFPWRMNESQKELAELQVRSAVLDKNSVLYGRFKFVEMDRISENEAVSLAERGLADADFVSGGAGRDIFFNGNESVSITANGRNHVSIQSLTAGSDIFTAYEAADKVETVLDKHLDFAFDSELGYLTPDPINVGTGMQASMLLHLPSLTDVGAAARISSNLSKIGFSLQCVYGSAAKPRGALYVISNRVTLGISENEILSNLKSMALQVIKREREARKELACDIKVQDTVYRTLGILQKARFMTDDELFDLVSVLRFGIEAGIVKNISYQCLNGLTLQAQPATLTLNAGRPLTQDERSARRACIVREALGGAG